MLVLGIDSSSARESVALLRDGRLLGEVHLDTSDVASRRLLPSVAFLLESAAIEPAQLDGLAVAVGPGSFTGLRVALSTVQGLALAGGKPCAGVTTLEALGRLGAEVGRPVAAMIDALRDEVYVALYTPDGVERLPARRDAPAPFIDQVPDDAVFVGDGAERYRDLIASRRPTARVLAGPAFLAAAVARLGAERLARGQGGGPEDLRPLYLREAHVTPSPAPALPRT